MPDSNTTLREASRPLRPAPLSEVEGPALPQVLPQALGAVDGSKVEGHASPSPSLPVSPAPNLPIAALPRQIREAIASASPASCYHATQHPRPVCHPPSLSPLNVRQPDDFPLYGLPQRWISNPLRLLALLDTDRRRIAANLPARHEAEIAHLERADLSPQVGRFYTVHAVIAEADEPRLQAIARRIVTEWCAARSESIQPNAEILIKPRPVVAVPPPSRAPAARPAPPLLVEGSPAEGSTVEATSIEGVHHPPSLALSVPPTSSIASPPLDAAVESLTAATQALGAAVESIGAAAKAHCVATKVLRAAARSHRVARKQLCAATKALRARKSSHRKSTRPTGNACPQSCARNNSARASGSPRRTARSRRSTDLVGPLLQKWLAGDRTDDPAVIAARAALADMFDTATAQFNSPEPRFNTPEIAHSPSLFRSVPRSSSRRPPPAPPPIIPFASTRLRRPLIAVAALVAILITGAAYLRTTPHPDPQPPPPPEAAQHLRTPSPRLNSAKPRSGTARPDIRSRTSGWRLTPGIFPPNPFPHKALRRIALAVGQNLVLQYKFRYAPDPPAPTKNHPAHTAMNALRVCALAAIFGPSLSADVQAAAPDEAGVHFFEQKIRPVLVEHCYSCHSAAARDAKKLQAALYLDTAAGVAAGGESGPVVVKGKSAESTLLKALKYDGFEMPPAGKLPDAVITDFAKWIDMGAPDPRGGEAPVVAKREINVAEGKKWWSFQPLAPSPRYSGERAGVRGPQSPVATSKAIDTLLLAAQKAQGVKPNHPASREKLIRRAYFDLVGLPPTPEQIAAFVADKSPQAFEKVVDQLLANPAYGERWARHWLDAARFAESNGYEFDAFRAGAYHYRDWVIESLNNDLPYDEFVRMQLAGDLLKPGDLKAAAAAGFLVAGPYPGQITAKTVEGIRYDQLDDMLMTVGGSMLGLTFGCVRCHDHKYDPIPQQDYYALAASLARTVHGAKTMDVDPAATAAALAKHEAEHVPLMTALETFAAKELPKRFEAWSKAEAAKLPDSTRWQAFEPIELEAARSYLKLLSDAKDPAAHLIAHDGSQGPAPSGRKRGRLANTGPAEAYRLVFHTAQKNLQALRLDTLTDKSLPQRGPGLNTDGSFQLAEVIVTAKSLDPKSKEAAETVKLKPVFAAFEDKDLGLKFAVDGKDNTAWVVKTTAKKDNGAIFEFEKPLAGFAGGTELVVELKFRDLGIGRLRVAFSTEPNPATWAGDLAPQQSAELRAAAAAGAKLPESLGVPLARWFAPLDAETAKVVRAERTHAAATPRPKLVEVYTTIAGGQDVFLLRRGEVANKLGKAEPGFVQVLMRAQPAPVGNALRGVPSAPARQSAMRPAPAFAVATGSSFPTPHSPLPIKSSAAPTDPRLALADQMTDVQSGAGPLLARVMANRLWQHHFGEGIVATPNDFGVQGERPSHPELLEYLSAELVRGGWRLKPLHRAMMLTDAYQQSHEVDPANLKLDPTNRLLWHFRPRRLEAESIRDALLAVGGNLDPQMYGPSVLDNTTRRGVYLRVKRSELIPSMTMFDAPEPTQSIGERSVTTVPTQALAMMNSPFVRGQAEKLAGRIRPTKGEPLETAIDRGYQIAFGRTPTAAERSQMKSFIGGQLASPGSAAPANAAAAEQAALDQALVEFCHVLLCLNEFVYVD